MSEVPRGPDRTELPSVVTCLVMNFIDCPPFPASPPHLPGITSQINYLHLGSHCKVTSGGWEGGNLKQVSNIY